MVNWYLKIAREGNVCDSTKNKWRKETIANNDKTNIGSVVFFNRLKVVNHFVWKDREPSRFARGSFITKVERNWLNGNGPRDQSGILPPPTPPPSHTRYRAPQHNIKAVTASLWQLHIRLMILGRIALPLNFVVYKEMLRFAFSNCRKKNYEKEVKTIANGGRLWKNVRQLFT